MPWKDGSNVKTPRMPAGRLEAEKNELVFIVPEIKEGTSVETY
jgi:hypothetical protein